MPRTALLLGSCIALSSAALVWYWQRPPAPAQPDSSSVQPVSSEAKHPAVPSNQSITAQQLQLLEAPQVRQQQQRLAFHSRYRNFIGQAAQLDAASRAAEAQALAEQIEALERQGELALSEALLLEVALIRADSHDEAEQKSRGEALIRRYKALSAEREARLAQRRSPNFERYKADEQRIVEEVMALQSIPDGLSRDQYLRQRLQEARERSYQ